MVEEHSVWRVHSHGSGMLIARDDTSASLRSLYPSALYELCNNTGGDDYSRGGTLVRRDERAKALRLRLYRRGGLLAALNSNLFLVGFGANRVRAELEVLYYLHAQGVPVPEPIGGYVEFVIPGLLYRCSIAVAEIPQSTSLLQFWKERGAADTHVDQQAREVAVLIRRVLALGVFHSDLYPGNVLVTSAGGLVLIDFDKAERFPASHAGKFSHYRAKYVERWRRGCRKHLPETVARGVIKEFETTLMAECEADGRTQQH